MSAARPDRNGARSLHRPSVWTTGLVLGALLLFAATACQEDPSHPPLHAVAPGQLAKTWRAQPHPSPTGQPTTTVPRPVADRPPNLPPGTTLAFIDDFSGTTLDEDDWTTCYPWGTERGCTNHSSGELQWYRPEQVAVSGGSLHLTADRRPTLGLDREGNDKSYDYTSGMVTTVGRFEFTYGYVQVHAKLPVGTGLWPVAWLLPTSLHELPEIDFMEARGQEPGAVHQYFHPKSGPVPDDLITGLSPGWHTFAVDWRPGSLVFLVDGIPHLVVGKDIPAEPMYLVLTLAVGGSFVGPPDQSTRFPSSLLVDRVEVWTY